jgi:hypothetical protein
MAATARAGPAGFGKYAEIITSLAAPCAEVGCVIPKQMSADTHARCQEIPDIPLAQQHAFTVEVAAVD